MSQELQRAVREVAERLNVPFAHLMAVAEVEGAGKAWGTDDQGSRQPLVRYEGHYFYRRLSGAVRDRAVRQGLAGPSWKSVKNPLSQAGRWRKLIRPAMAINRQAALESCWWGFLQVMGSHWKVFGFTSVSEFVDVARSGVAGQLELGIRFFEANKIVGALRRGDWEHFTRVYNGKAQVTKYSKRIRRAVRKWESGGARPSSDGMLRVGSKGGRVAELQRLLRRAGYSLDVDGDFGPATKDKVKQFQEFEGLSVDGVAGPETMKALDRFRQTNDDIEKVPASKQPEVVGGGAVAGGGAIVGVGVEEAKETLQDVGYQIEPMTGGGGAVDILFTVIQFGILAAVLGGLGFMAYGWWKRRQTKEA